MISAAPLLTRSLTAGEIHAGDRVDMLTVIGLLGIAPSGHRRVLCRCDCGGRCVRGVALLMATTKRAPQDRQSCGCRLRANKLRWAHRGQILGYRNMHCNVGAAEMESAITSVTAGEIASACHDSWQRLNDLELAPGLLDFDALDPVNYYQLTAQPRGA